MEKTPPHEKTRHLRTTDLRAGSQLAVAVVQGLIDLVENLHHNIAHAPWPLGTPIDRPTTGITGLVYRSTRGVTRLVGGSLDALLGQVEELLGSSEDHHTSPRREAVVSALNGVIGDRLAAQGNSLAIAMVARHGGRNLPRDAAGLAQRLHGAGGRVLLMVHGFCMGPAQWLRNGHDHGRLLADEGGFTALHLHYNSGRHVSDNGRDLAILLQDLQRCWPVPLEEIVIVGHSMGGLVVRSACHQALQRGDSWPSRLRKLVFLGTPHHGAPLARGGHWLDGVLGASPYTAAFSKLARKRSAGNADLRHGSLLATDWADTNAFAHGHDTRTPVPLPAGVDCYSVAASLGKRAGDLKDAMLGDGLVPIDSALGRHTQARRCLAFDADKQRTVLGIGHMDLLDSADVFAQLRRWLLPVAAAVPAEATG